MNDDISKLNERITFRTKISVPDDMGGRVLKWADSQTMWAWVEPLRYNTVNMERIESESKAPSRSVYRVRIRTGNELPKADQVKWRNKAMRILTRPITLPDRKWIEFQAIEES